MSAASRRSACKESAVTGERSSWAASARNRRCTATDSATRARRRLIAATKGRISSGNARSGIWLQSASEELSRSSATLFNGWSIRRTVAPITSGRRAIRIKRGATARSALLLAISLRTAVCWPTAIRRPRSWLLMTKRQGTPPMATVWRPSGALTLKPVAAPAGSHGPCGSAVTTMSRDSGSASACPAASARGAEKRCRSAHAAVWRSWSSCSSMASRNAYQ